MSKKLLVVGLWQQGRWPWVPPWLPGAATSSCFWEGVRSCTVEVPVDHPDLHESLLPRARGGHKEFRLEATLKAAGTRPRSSRVRADLEQALASGKYDLVLADSSTCRSFQRRPARRRSKPVVVPVLYNPTPDELATSEKKYNCLSAPRSRAGTS